MAHAAPSPPLAGALGASSVAAANDGDEARFNALQRQLAQVQAVLQQLAGENRALREHEREVDRKLAELAAVAQAGSPSPALAQAAAALSPPRRQPWRPSRGGLPNASALPTAAAAPGNSLAGLGAAGGGDGEVYYTDPTSARNQSQFDPARAVFGIGYAFDERTEFNSEYEVEHAVASSTDVGEFEVEQFYVATAPNEAVSVRAGLFLMPLASSMSTTSRSISTACSATSSRR